jgi:DNA-binding transcriptional LysR family regulator
VYHPAVVRAFRSERPDVQLVLTVAPSGSLLESLRAGSLDLAVCVEPPSPIAGVETEPLLAEPLSVMAPPGTRIGAPAGWGPWVLFPGSSHTRQQVEMTLRTLGAPVRIAAESHQPDVLLQMVHMGLGWTVLPPGAVGTGAVSVGRTLLERRIVLARRSGSVHDPAADELAERLRRA